MEIVSINEKTLDDKTLPNLESSLDKNLEFFIKKIYSKFNYSPIIRKTFGRKITFSELE